MNLKKAPIHVHHITSHFTSAMFPAASLMLTMHALGASERFEAAAYYCIVFATFAAPMVYASGAYDWRTRFQARHTTIFDHKLVVGVALVLFSAGLVAIRTLWPESVAAGNGFAAYLLAVYLATAMAVYLGHLGSKFI
ncbi:MAG: hypothetical protein HY804_01630 [Nitrospinae bacterium]|nr:hypothetical protein [Nitrospinota bacterium]